MGVTITLTLSLTQFLTLTLTLTLTLILTLTPSLTRKLPLTRTQTSKDYEGRSSREQERGGYTRSLQIISVNPMHKRLKHEIDRANRRAPIRLDKYKKKEEEEQEQ